VLALVALGLVVVFDLALFGWLIFRSLSQREIEQVLLETRQEAEDIADRIAGRAEAEGTDLYTVMALERETRTYIDDVLKQRGVVSEISVHDAEGTLVFHATAEVTEPMAEGEEVLDLDQPREIPGEVRTEQAEESTEYRVEEPIGDFGVLRIGISEQDLQRRIGELRHELIGQASAIGGVTTALLVAALTLIWFLLRRGQRLEAQAAEAERMAYIGTLASGLAHEIRNPLNSLNLNMQMLEEELCEPSGSGAAPTGRRLLTITRSEIGRLERLVTDFLSYARPRALELEEVEVSDLLEQVRELLAGEARSRGVSLEVVDRSGGAEVRVDPAQVRQLLLNLSQNALAAVEGRSAPRVVLAAEPSGPGHGSGGGRLEAGGEGRANAVELSVRDNGCGIPSDEVDRIFDVFYSTRKGGTGLGLAIVDRIARRHGGAVEVESQPGKGTTFRVAFPRVARDPVDLPVDQGADLSDQSSVSSSSSTGSRNSSRSSLPQTSQRASVISPSFHSKT
jgi:signal transduction histidine kinase